MVIDIRNKHKYTAEIETFDECLKQIIQTHDHIHQEMRTGMKNQLKPFVTHLI